MTDMLLPVGLSQRRYCDWICGSGDWPGVATGTGTGSGHDTGTGGMERWRGLLRACCCGHAAAAEPPAIGSAENTGIGSGGRNQLVG